jgi:hypothetical protein
MVPEGNSGTKESLTLVRMKRRTAILFLFLQDEESRRVKVHFQYIEIETTVID